jgi:hypothetical protein
MRGVVRRWACLLVLAGLPAAAWSHGTLPRLLPVLDPPAVAPSPPGRLFQPRTETPTPLDPDAEHERCAACRLAAATTGQLPAGSYRIESRAVADGVLLSVTASEAPVREALWKAMEARAALVEALRAGDAVQLCDACRARHVLLADLRIAARRTPEGLVLVYTSPTDAVVRRIQAVLRQTGSAPVQFQF